MKKLILPIIGGALLTLLALTLTACGGKATASSSPGASTAVVTTLAGKAGVTGSADGSGAAARFNNPFDVAVDAAGNVYVDRRQQHHPQDHTRRGGHDLRRQGRCPRAIPTARARRRASPTPAASPSTPPATSTSVEAGPNVILKITPAGQVTTLAGKYDVTGSTDGKGAAARFSWPPGRRLRQRRQRLRRRSSKTTPSARSRPPGWLPPWPAKPASWAASTAPVPRRASTAPAASLATRPGTSTSSTKNNNTIRKITPAGVVTTFAGKAGVSGSADGTGAAASFSIPTGICYDPANGDLYVADSENCTIRRITPAGVVTTIAGKYGSVGSADGTGAAASFDSPTGVAVDAAGDLYVCDQTNNTIRKITFTK